MKRCPACHCDLPAEARFCAACGSRTEPAPAGIEGDMIGRCLQESYRIERRLGGGAFGEVYLATQLALQSPVVVKVLKDRALGDRRNVERFRREAHAVSRLRHPNTVRVFDFGTLDDGRPFMAMEYLEGHDLRQALADGFPLEPARIARMMEMVSGSLAEAHELRMVHRDLKPENIMLVSAGGEPDFVKVVDFGLVRLFEAEQQPGDRLTSAGIVCGTPAFMSPEQVSSQPLDGRSDIYSLGVVLYELLTGALPFSGADPGSVLMKHLTEMPTPPGGIGLPVDPGLEEICLACLSKLPEHRPQSCRELERLFHAHRRRLTVQLAAATGLPPGQIAPGRGSRTGMTAERQHGQRIPTGLLFSIARSGPLSAPTEAAPAGEPPARIVMPGSPSASRFRRVPVIAGFLAMTLLAAGAVLWALLGGSSRPVDDPPVSDPPMVVAPPAVGNAPPPPPSGTPSVSVPGEVPTEVAPARSAPPTARAAGRAVPTSPSSLVEQAGRLLAAGDLTGAKMACLKALKADPAFGPAHRGLAAAYEREGMRELAARSLEAYLRVEPRAQDRAEVEDKIRQLRR